MIPFARLPNEDVIGHHALYGPTKNFLYVPTTSGVSRKRLKETVVLLSA